jgi:hypothetical protein
MTLETIYTLVSREQHQWINALCINTLPNKTDEVIVGVSVSGVIKLWTLGFNEPKVNNLSFLYPFESREAGSCVFKVDASTL